MNLQIGDKAMVKIVNPVKTNIREGHILPVVYTELGLMADINGAGIFVYPDECRVVNMPLQCILDEHPADCGCYYCRPII